MFSRKFILTLYIKLESNIYFGSLSLLITPPICHCDTIFDRYIRNKNIQLTIVFSIQKFLNKYIVENKHFYAY